MIVAAGTGRQHAGTFPPRVVVAGSTGQQRAGAARPRVIVAGRRMVPGGGQVQAVRDPLGEGALHGDAQRVAGARRPVQRRDAGAVPGLGDAALGRQGADDAGDGAAVQVLGRMQ
ncbi:hypothetical protein [Dactylosporangium darangshiense]|uniref:Uncharacterized protein n=1 Tax=Dactylosporangium darangshiense TaxID=579108 RepID=A0ABP8DRD6_9ACTN